MQLISALVHSRTDYAASVWHQHGANSATIKAIQRIDNVACRFALGVFKTHPLTFLKHDTASPSALHRLNARAEKAVARLLTLPSTNPAADLARQVRAEPRKAHRSCLHFALHSTSSTLASINSPIESISLSDATLTPPEGIRAMIAVSKEAAANFVLSQLATRVRSNPTRAMAFSDGSLTPGEGVGAAAVHHPSSTVYPVNLGDPTHHTVYEAELVGIRMAAALARAHRTALQTSFWFFIDNQPSIRALTQPLKPSSGLSLRRQALNSLKQLTSLSPHANVNLVWCPAHVGIQENEEADQAAKEAAKTGAPQVLPASLSAVKQQINAAYKTKITDQPSPLELRRLRGSYNPIAVRKALSALPRHAASAVAQLRAGHTPLLAFLHRIHVVDDPNCLECSQPETNEHFLMLCKRYHAH